MNEFVKFYMSNAIYNSTAFWHHTRVHIGAVTNITDTRAVVDFEDAPIWDISSGFLVLFDVFGAALEFKEYTVDFIVRRTYSIEVYADSDEEALEYAKEYIFDEGELEDVHYEEA